MTHWAKIRPIRSPCEAGKVVRAEVGTDELCNAIQGKNKLKIRIFDKQMYVSKRSFKEYFWANAFTYLSFSAHKMHSKS
jgi:hypothetical protein